MPDVFVIRGALTPEHCALVVPRFVWTGSLAPAGPGNKCTQGSVWEPGCFRTDLTCLFEHVVIATENKGLPFMLNDVQNARGWGSSTPAGVPIAAHAHDGDLVLCVYLDLPELPEPLEVEPADYVCTKALGITRAEDGWVGVAPEIGMVLCWPSSHQHRVPAGYLRGGERVCAVWNVTLIKKAA